MRVACGRAVGAIIPIADMEGLAMHYVVTLMHRFVDHSHGREPVSRTIKTGQIDCRSHKEAERVARLFSDGASEGVIENLFAVICVRVVLADQRMVTVPVDKVAGWARELSADAARLSGKPIKVG